MVASMVGCPLFPAGTAQGLTCRTNIPQSTPTDRFEIRNEGKTVVDTKTALEWQRCGLDSTFGNNGTPDQYDDDYCYYQKVGWQVALQRVEAINTPLDQVTPSGLSGKGGYAGFTDWRVPNTKELSSITERTCFRPSVNWPVFPGTPSNHFWSSSSNVDSPHYAEVIDFALGQFTNDDKRFDADYVRLVRDAQ